MMSKKLFLLGGMMAVLFMLPTESVAQHHFSKPPLTPKKVRQLTKKEVISYAGTQIAAPANFVGQRSYTEQSPIPWLNKKSHALNKPIITTPDGTQLWGNVIYADSWKESSELPPTGMYSFTATENPVMTPMAIVNFPAATGGGVYYDGKLKYLYYLNSYGYVIMFLYTYDTETWQMPTNPVQIQTYEFYAVSTTYDPITKKAYGCYYNQDGTQLEIAQVDYETMTHTKLAATDTTYYGFAANKQGEIYAISEGGNLYKVDKTNGAVTKIGFTGVKPDKYVQSAAFDMRTGKLYWASQETNGSHLYEVNTQTGAATRIGSFPDHEEVTCLYVPMPLAEDGAPAVVTDLALAFDNASKSGSVTFKAPSKTFAGNPLTGNLTYRIKADGNEVGIGRIEAGKTVTANVTVPSTGDVLFTVTTENAIGVSPEVKQKAWIGYDIPASPVVTLKIGADNKATVSWTAPEGLHAGYLGALKYDVVRYPDSVKIANQTTATTISDQLSVGQLKAYSYGVTAFTNETKGETGMSNYVAIGNPIEVPYLEDFSDEGSFALYTVIDANNDGKTWEWFEGAAGTNANKEKAADDWLITPAVHLAPGYLYSVSLKARSTFATFPERFEVKYGKGNTIADMTTELVPEEQISTPKYKTYGKEIVVTDDGNYNFGIHCVSEANMYSLLIDSINIVKKASLAAPDSVTNLVLTPGDMGKMEATIAFRTPTQTIAGNSLSSLTKIEILRNGQLIHTFNAPATGTQLSYKDEGVTLNGINKYTVIPYNTESAGLQYETSAFVGEDVPAKPMARLIDGQTKITIEWLASSIGKNGGYVNADKLKYTIYAIDNSGYNELIAENISGTSYDVPFNTDEGDQRLIQYTIQAEGVGGKSGFVGTEGIVVGAPFTLPFHEGVPGGKMTMPLWWIESMDDMNPFRMFYGMSSDEDNGCFVWYSMKENEWTSMNTGKIKTAGGGSNLSLAYDYYALPGRNVSLAIKAQKADGTEDVLREIDFRKLTGGEAWATDIVPLAQYAAERYVILKFKYTSNEKRLQLYLDNISVLNLDNNNLKVAVDAPEKATSGTTADFKVRVENTGKAVTNGYRLTVTVDGKTFKEENNESLAPMKHRDVRMTIPIGAAEQGKKVVSVGIDYTDDYADDNVAVANINVEPSKLPQPRAFEAKAEDGNIVRMTWQAPMETTETGTEDFEAYAPWIMENIGDWTVIDGDKLETYNVFQNTSWPHINEPQAFLVYNLANLGYDVTQINPDHVPHSGNQCLISVNGNGVNDNWLISPLLSGKAQKIKFYASSMNPNYPETFEIMYSATGKNTEDFKKIADFPDAEGGWNEYSAELPEGAKYFAIRLISNNRLALLVDDITFEGAAINPTGYNIYRDGNLLKTMNAEARAAEDHTDRNHTYGLTALYAKGESVPVTSNVTAITTIETANGRHYTVYTLDGKHVGTRLNSLNSLPSGVYIVNGKKITVK